MKPKPIPKKHSPDGPAEPGSQLSQEQLLRQLAQAARQCAEFEKRLGENPAPELESIIKVHRMLVMNFSLEAQQAPELLKLVKDLMNPLMEWAQLEERRKQRKLAERKHRDLIEARNREGTGEKAQSLTPNTLAKIENELSLL